MTKNLNQNENKGKKAYKDIQKEGKKTLLKFKNDVYFCMATYLGILEAKNMVVKKLETTFNKQKDIRKYIENKL